MGLESALTGRFMYPLSYLVSEHVLSRVEIIEYRRRPPFKQRCNRLLIQKRSRRAAPATRSFQTVVRAQVSGRAAPLCSAGWQYSDRPDRWKSRGQARRNLRRSVSSCQWRDARHGLTQAEAVSPI